SLSFETTRSLNAELSRQQLDRQQRYSALNTSRSWYPRFLSQPSRLAQAERHFTSMSARTSLTVLSRLLARSLIAVTLFIQLVMAARHSLDRQLALTRETLSDHGSVRLLDVLDRVLRLSICNYASLFLAGTNSIPTARYESFVFSCASARSLSSTS